MEGTNIQAIEQMTQQSRDNYFMTIALDQARQAYENDEVPVGATIVWNDTQIIATTHNSVETNKNATHHAELICINQAIEQLGLKYLTDATLYVTLEPCAMCAGALVLTKVKRLVYGANDPKAGAVSTLYQITTDNRLNHRLEITSGIMQDECSQILKDFFRKLRDKKIEIPD